MIDLSLRKFKPKITKLVCSFPWDSNLAMSIAKVTFIVIASITYLFICSSFRLQESWLCVHTIHTSHWWHRTCRVCWMNEWMSEWMVLSYVRDMVIWGFCTNIFFYCLLLLPCLAGIICFSPPSHYKWFHWDIHGKMLLLVPLGELCNHTMLMSCSLNGPDI